MATKSAKKKTKKERLTRGKLIKMIDRLVSIVVRYKNAKKIGDSLCAQCVTCKRWLPVSKCDCSHYIRRGCLPLRFDPKNVAVECSFDNRSNPDHLAGYSDYLIKKYGAERIAWLVKTKQDWKDGKIKPFKMDELKKIYNDNLKEVRKIEKKWNIQLIPANRKEL